MLFLMMRIDRGQTVSLEHSVQLIVSLGALGLGLDKILVGEFSRGV